MLQKLSVPIDKLLELSIKLIHLQHIFVLLLKRDKIEVFLDRIWCDYSFAFATMSASFEIECRLKLCLVDNLKRVFHQHYCDRLHHWPSQGEHAIDFCKHRVWVRFEVGYIFWQDLFQGFQLGGLHRLDQKLIVVTKEKETAALARAFTGIKDLLLIYRWAQTHFDQRKVNIVGLKQFDEQISAVECYRKVGLDVLCGHQTGLSLAYSLEGTWVLRESSAQLALDVNLLIRWLPGVKFLNLDLSYFESDVLPVYTISQIDIVLISRNFLKARMGELYDTIKDNIHKLDIESRVKVQVDRFNLLFNEQV